MIRIPSTINNIQNKYQLTIESRISVCLHSMLKYFHNKIRLVVFLRKFASLQKTMKIIFFQTIILLLLTKYLKRFLKTRVTFAKTKGQ